MSEQFFDVQKLRRRPKTRARVLAWIAALRSGEYRRTSGRLRRTTTRGTDRYCCLGVACDIIKPGKVDGSAFLTASEAERFALLGGTADGSAQRKLANLNDHGTSFKRIARKLERVYAEALA